MARPTQQQAERKYAAILKAAVAAFRKNGYASTSMDQIAADAGVSKRTVYNHFPSKDGLFEHILEKLWVSGNACLDVPYRNDRALDTQLAELVDACVQLYSDAKFLDLARVAIAELIHTPQRARPFLERMANQESGLTRWIRSALEDGRLSPSDPVYASQQLQALIKGFAFWPQVTLGHPPLSSAERNHLVSTTTQMFLSQHACPTPSLQP